MCVQHHKFFVLMVFVGTEEEHQVFMSNSHSTHLSHSIHIYLLYAYLYINYSNGYLDLF